MSSRERPSKPFTPSASPSSRRGGGDRAPVDLDVLFQTSGQAPRFGKLQNLSPGGACIETNRPSPTGEFLLIHLPWPSRDEPTTLTGLVRWSEQRRIGVQFSGTGPSEVAAIARLERERALSGTPSKPRPGKSAETEEFSRDALLAVSKVVHSMDRRVRFQEVDAAGTIYYSRIFEYFGDVYIELLERDGLSIPKVMSQREWFAPLVHAEADYLAPMRFGDTVVVTVAKVRCGTSAATVGYRIATRDGRALAVGHTVHVFVDGATFRPCPVPAEVRRALTGETTAG